DAVGNYGSRAHVEKDGDVDADVVAAVGERYAGHGPHGDVLALDLCVVVVIIVPAPGLPRGPQSQAKWDQPEVRDGPRGQEGSRAQGDEHSDAEDADEAKILAGQNACGGSALACSAGEKQRQDDDVVDIGGNEQADRLQGRGQDHACTSVA